MVKYVAQAISLLLLAGFRIFCINNVPSALSFFLTYMSEGLKECFLLSTLLLLVQPVLLL